MVSIYYCSFTSPIFDWSARDRHLEALKISTLKESNIDYTFYQELNPLPMIEYEQEMFATKFIFNHPLFDFIDKDRFWGWPILRFIGGKNLYDSVKLDDLTDTDSHYGQKTHDHYAEFIIQKGMDL